MKYVCSVCGYVHEGTEAPERCPQCKAPKEKFNVVTGENTYACEHVVASTEGIDPWVVEGLRANFTGECCEVGMYLAMSRQAEREGYPEIAEAYKRYAFEEAEHAAKFAELLGEVLTSSTKRTSRCVPKPSAEPAEANSSSQNAPKSWVMMLSTTPSTRWQKMKPATEKASKACSNATSANNRAQKKWSTKSGVYLRFLFAHFLIRRDRSWRRGKLLFTRKEVFPFPNPLPFSRKAEYFVE